jgi:rubrerythrin
LLGFFNQSFALEGFMAVSNSWSDWWLRFLGLAPDGAAEAVELLRHQYIQESQHAARLRQHAERMHYPQFRDALLRIAADESTHLDAISEMLRRLGSTSPGVPEIAPSEKNSWQYLSEDLEEEQRSAADLMEQAVSIRDRAPAAAELLERIADDGKKYRAIIREMLMKSDPQAQMAA